MIPILYPADEAKKGTNAFKSNGLGGLGDAISCVVTEERNSTYELEMLYPVEGVRFKDLQNDRLIYCKPNETSSNQIFRIYQIEKPINGQVTVRAEHISYLLTKAVCLPFEASGVTEAFTNIRSHLKWHTSNPNFPTFPFTFWADNNSQGTIKIELPKSIRAVLGGEEGSITDAVGGEYEWDNFTVKHYAHRGTDSGITLRYGKNITDLNAGDDISEVWTGILPYWKGNLDDTKKTLNDDWEVETNREDVILYIPNYTVWTNHTSDYAYPMCTPVDMSSIMEVDDYEQPDIEQGEEEDDTTYSYRVVAARRAAEAEYKQYLINELVKASNDYVKDNTGWKVSNSLKVSFVPLWNTEEYADFAALERVGLCDEVTVWYPKLNVSEKLKVIKTEYNVLLGRYNSIELGESKGSAAASISSTFSLKDDFSKSIESTQLYLEQSIDRATKLVSGGLGGYVVLGRNSAGKPNEILIMDAPSKSRATHVIRMNVNGIGFSTTGYNGPFKNAWTIDGHLVADFMDTGTLTANIIRAGVLTNTAGTFYLDMEGSEVKMEDGVIRNSGSYWDNTGVHLKGSDVFSIDILGRTAIKSYVRDGLGGLQATFVDVETGYFNAPNGWSTYINSSTGLGIDTHQIGWHTTGGTGACFITCFSDRWLYLGGNGGNGNLEVNGEVKADSLRGIVYDESDARIKENIVDLEDDNALDFIMSLKPKKYNLIRTPDEQRYGFIAQEVEKHLPRDGGIVNYGYGRLPGQTEEEHIDDMRAINYSDIIPFLVSVIQQQEKRISELEKICLTEN